MNYIYSEDFTSKLLIAVLASALTVFSTLFIRYLDERRRTWKIRKTINFYLQHSVIHHNQFMIDNYEKARKMISTFSRKGESVKAFEWFSDDIYKAMKPEDIFKAYTNKFILVHSIFSMIKYVSKDLPLKVAQDCTDEINNHLDTEEGKKLKGEERKNHFETCRHCEDVRSRYSHTIDLRIRELKAIKHGCDQIIETRWLQFRLEEFTFNIIPFTEFVTTNQ